jgi:hypothetical protein
MPRVGDYQLVRELKSIEAWQSRRRDPKVAVQLAAIGRRIVAAEHELWRERAKAFSKSTDRRST